MKKNLWQHMIFAVFYLYSQESQGTLLEQDSSSTTARISGSSLKNFSKTSLSVQINRESSPQTELVQYNYQGQPISQLPPKKAIEGLKSFFDESGRPLRLR